ncbi:hypothetical protein [Gallintestinimicrobium sp.]|uniref:hypothetical protein n=1 Tax=Gallintestinimicrobium sp. TaxID=2981655 RepID=UPI003992CFE5
MSEIFLCGGAADATVLSNVFIDEYLKDANDAQLKVYLFLVRRLQAGDPVSISDMADRFNHTEKDILRALCYWEKCGVLTLKLSPDRTTLQQIRLLPFPRGRDRTQDKLIFLRSRPPDIFHATSDGLRTRLAALIPNALATQPAILSKALTRPCPEQPRTIRPTLRLLPPDARPHRRSAALRCFPTSPLSLPIPMPNQLTVWTSSNPSSSRRTPRS